MPRVPIIPALVKITLSSGPVVLLFWAMKLKEQINNTGKIQRNPATEIRLYKRITIKMITGGRNSEIIANSRNENQFLPAITMQQRLSSNITCLESEMTVVLLVCALCLAFASR